MRIVKVPASYYQQFDADRNLEFTAEGYAGWQKEELELDLDSTAVVVMHAWDCGTWEEFPGWHRAVEYIPRSYDICKSVFPELLRNVRASGVKVYHVVRPGSTYFKGYPGYDRAVSLSSGNKEAYEQIAKNPVRQKLDQFRAEHVFPGLHNRDDIARGQRKIDFPEEAKPVGNEGVAENANQLLGLCKEDGVNHLIYTGFAINGCLLTSPGGMLDMQKRGLLCSAVRQAVTAIENKETVRTEAAKQLALWYVAVMFGFVYESDDLIRSLKEGAQPGGGYGNL
ncbi:MAG: hypothetical protein K0R28_6174 [Paenibacillus sp.]|jgi:nicotinamidase-related amidase|nr:hypothetical protein [Paenibacillus sp.]